MANEPVDLIPVPSGLSAKQFIKRSIPILALIVSLSGCERPDSSSNMNPKNEADIIPVQPDDTEMVTAMQTARDRFPEFWSEVSTDYKRVIPALGGSMVKAYFHDPEDSEGGEHMWVSEVEYDGATITGVLADRPGHVHSVRSGDRVSFPLEHLSDWLYVDEDKAIGAFTVRLLRSRMTEKQRQEHDSHYPFNFE